MNERKLDRPDDAWPALPLEAWKEIVGKVRLALAPRMNHWWQVPLYVDARGLTTSAVPYASGVFEIRFDFIDHRLVIETSRGDRWRMALEPRAVADFYREVLGARWDRGSLERVTG